jgi:hypothetical protein
VPLEELGQLKSPLTSGIEPTNFRLVVHWRNQLGYRVPPVYHRIFISVLTGVLYLFYPNRSPYNSFTLFLTKDRSKILHCVLGHYVSVLLTRETHVFKFPSLHFLYMFTRLNDKCLLIDKHENLN